MGKPIKIDVEELVEAGIIPSSTADNITTYYQSKQADAPNRLLLVFGVLGALLIGLGIILIIAHNWDQFPRWVKNVFAFLPMLGGQAACAYTLRNKSDSALWRESASTFLVFAVGACIAMVSQIYNIQGDLGSFLLTWILLGLPLVYVMRSSVTALLYIMGVVGYTLTSGFKGDNEPYICWGLLALILPYYYQLFKNRRASNSFTFLSWAVAGAGLLLLATWESGAEPWLAVAYMSLLSIYYLLGHLAFFKSTQLRNKPFFLIGTIGTIGAFIFFTFPEFWESLMRHSNTTSSLLQQREFWVAMGLTGIATLLLVQLIRQEKGQVAPIAYGAIVFLGLVLLSSASSIFPTIISNIFVLATGVYYIYQGSQQQRLSILNLGLLTLALLIIVRFMDLNLSFVTRGLLFIVMGIGFFLTNYKLMKGKK